MITTVGSTHIKNYLAGLVPNLATGIAIGIADDTPLISDRQLGFEVARMQINTSVYDPAQDRIVFKADIPTNYIGKIFEVGLFSSLDTESGSTVLSECSSTADQWELISGNNLLFNNSGTRLGSDSLRLAAGTNESTTVSSLSYIDLSAYSNQDIFSVAAKTNGETQSLALVFMTDTDNYFTLTVPGTLLTDYAIYDIIKGSAVTTGNPTWEVITEMRIVSTSKSTAPSITDVDAISIIDQDFADPNAVMIAREVITPVEKAAGSVNEIEFYMAVNV